MLVVPTGARPLQELIDALDRITPVTEDDMTDSGVEYTGSEVLASETDILNDEQESGAVITGTH